jgi:hypothetical protein
LDGRVVILDDAGSARWADIAALRHHGVRLVALVDLDRWSSASGWFSHPDLVLAHPHPSTLGDPIRSAARAILAGRHPHDDGTAIRIKDRLTLADPRCCDMVLCATERTRRRLNQAVRFARGIIPGPLRTDGRFDPQRDFPRAGEPVITTRGDDLHWRGELGMLEEVDFPPGATRCALLIDHTEGQLWQPDCVRFADMPSPLPEPTPAVEIDLAYTLRLSEAGSARWRRVVAVDELPDDDPLRPRWLYSACCCASERITLIRRNPNA